VRGVTEDGRTETGSVGVMPSKMRLQNGPGYCLSVWCSVAEVQFSPVQTPFCPNLNLNLLHIFWTWTEPEPCVQFRFEPSEPYNFLKSYFSIFFRVQMVWNACAISKISYLCEGAAQTTFDKPNRYCTTDPNKHTCRKATQNMAITHHPVEGLIHSIKILK
jgi:hypothetical protein